MSATLLSASVLAAIRAMLLKRLCQFGLRQTLFVGGKLLDHLRRDFVCWRGPLMSAPRTRPALTRTRLAAAAHRPLMMSALSALRSAARTTALAAAFLFRGVSESLASVSAFCQYQARFPPQGLGGFLASARGACP